MKTEVGERDSTVYLAGGRVSPGSTDKVAEKSFPDRKTKITTKNFLDTGKKRKNQRETWKENQLLGCFLGGEEQLLVWGKSSIIFKVGYGKNPYKKKERKAKRKRLGKGSEGEKAKRGLSQGNRLQIRYSAAEGVLLDNESNSTDRPGPRNHHKGGGGLKGRVSTTVKFGDS